MIVTLACAPARVNVPVEEPSSMRRARCPSAFVTTMWTLLAALRGAEASCSTSAGDFFSSPLVVVRAAVVAPPQALATMVTSAVIAVAAVRAIARRMKVIEIPPRAAVHGRPEPHADHRMRPQQAGHKGQEGPAAGRHFNYRPRRRSPS